MKELLKDQPNCILSDSLSLEAVIFPFVYLESHPFLNFYNYALNRSEDFSKCCVFSAVSVIYSVQIRFFQFFYFKQVC